MVDPIHREAELVAALKLTAGPPREWVQAAAMIPSTLGDLAQIGRAVASPEFRERFAHDPRAAVAEAGLSPWPPLIDALRARFADVGSA